MVLLYTINSIKLRPSEEAEELKDDDSSSAMTGQYLRQSAAFAVTVLSLGTAMTQLLNLAITLTPSHHHRNHRLFQSPPYRHATAADAFLSTTNSKGGACCAYLKPLCQSQQGQQAHTQQDGPDISGLDPALQQQWDHAANAQLGNIIIKPQSSRKVVWTCDQCPDGHLHSWSAIVQTRTFGNGCPQCSGRQVCKHSSLATKAPLVAAEWDYEANDCTPDDVMSGSNRLVGWRCQACGGSWKATPNHRVGKSKSGCPHCAIAKTKKTIKHPTFAECQHPLLAEWDHRRNAAQGHHPDNIRLRSSKQIFWLCTKCPAGQQHSWSARPASRTARLKSGCPFCAGQAGCLCNSLLARYPDIAAEWDYSKNEGRPSDYAVSSTHKAWWSSPQRGSWQQSITWRTDQVQRRATWLKRRQQHQVSAGLKPRPTEG